MKSLMTLQKREEENRAREISCTAQEMYVKDMGIKINKDIWQLRWHQRECFSEELQYRLMVSSCIIMTANKHLYTFLNQSNLCIKCFADYEK